MGIKTEGLFGDQYAGLSKEEILNLQQAGIENINPAHVQNMLALAKRFHNKWFPWYSWEVLESSIKGHDVGKPIVAQKNYIISFTDAVTGEAKSATLTGE